MLKPFIKKLKQFGKGEPSPAKTSKPKGETWSVLDIVSVIFRTVKLLLNVAFVFIFFGIVLGAGLGLGYAASLFSDVSVPKQEELVSQVNKISGISKLIYADGELISEIDNDLLRIPVASDAISDNVKNAIIAPAKVPLT